MTGFLVHMVIFSPRHTGVNSKECKSTLKPLLTAKRKLDQELINYIVSSYYLLSILKSVATA